MTEFYALFPQMAIKCHLAAVYPPNSGINTTWPKACVDFFVELTEMDKCTEFLTIYVCKEKYNFFIVFKINKIMFLVVPMLWI